MVDVGFQSATFFYSLPAPPVSLALDAMSRATLFSKTLCRKTIEGVDPQAGLSLPEGSQRVEAGGRGQTGQAVPLLASHWKKKDGQFSV